MVHPWQHADGLFGFGVDLNTVDTRRATPCCVVGEFSTEGGCVFNCMQGSCYVIGNSTMGGCCSAGDATTGGGGVDSLDDSATGVNFPKIIFSPSVVVGILEDASSPCNFSSLRCW